MKICSECKISKDLQEFYKDSKALQGVKSKCKICVEAYKKIYRANNKEKIKLSTKKYYETNIESILKKKKEYKISNQHRIRETNNLYRKANREKILTSQRLHYQKVKDTAGYKQRRKTYMNKKWSTDIQFRVTTCLRQRIRDALGRETKMDSTMSLIGCSIDNLKMHIEHQFQAGMTWNNHGSKGWHIDHVLPCRMFNLSLDSEQRKCFHFTNLQPMWAKDNLIKGGTFDIEDDTLTSIYLLFES